MMQSSRRDVLKAGAAGPAKGSMPALAQRAPQRKIQVGVQQASDGAGHGREDERGLAGNGQAFFSEAAVTAKTAGMVVGYHNHQHEFKDKFDDGTCKWETFFSNASPDVCSQMDVGHVVSAGEDPQLL